MRANIPMKGRADLHNHTTASDGLLTPTQLVKYAAEKGLEAVAITDHDSTDGIVEGIRAGEKYNVYVVPGIELNTHINDIEIHILGYFIDIHFPEMQDILKRIKEVRRNRGEMMVNNLYNLYGIDINYMEVLQEAKEGGVGRAHLGRVLLEKGYVKDLEEAFQKYLGTDCPVYVSRYKLTAEEGIVLITKAGGVPVLAHPGLVKDQNLIPALLDMGIRGIEVFHSKHTQDQADYFKSLALCHSLLITGGSDCHGELFDGMPIVGDISVDTHVINELINISGYNNE